MFLNILTQLQMMFRKHYKYKALEFCFYFWKTNFFFDKRNLLEIHYS